MLDGINTAQNISLHLDVQIKVHSLSVLHLSDVVENIDDVPDLARGFFNLGCQGYAGHGGCFHRVPHHGLGIIKSLEQHLTCCHGHLLMHTKREMKDYKQVPNLFFLPK